MCYQVLVQERNESCTPHRFDAKNPVMTIVGQKTGVKTKFTYPEIQKREKCAQQIQVMVAESKYELIIICMTHKFTDA